MKINWMHPVRGVQAVLSTVVLGLMAYGALLNFLLLLFTANVTSSVIMVDNALAPVLTFRSELSHLHSGLVSSRAHSTSSHSSPL